MKKATEVATTAGDVQNWDGLLEHGTLVETQSHRGEVDDEAIRLHQ